MTRSVTQRAADHYSSLGTAQAMVGVYNDEALVYAQVGEATAKKLASRLCMIRIAVQVEAGALSADGLTYCWWLRRSRLTPGDGGANAWLPMILTMVAAIFRQEAPQVLGEDGSIHYVDNRYKDHNRVADYAELLQ